MKYQFNRKKEALMKNFVFISPNFPTNYWNFCHHLKANGMNVLGIGDQPYDELLPELQLPDSGASKLRSQPLRVN